MKNLVRGAAILSLLSLFVVFIYAQAETGSTLAIATDSQQTIENNISNNNLDNNFSQQSVNQQEDGKKLVKTTGSVKVSGAGASRGAFSATAYCLTGKTAMGHGVRRGIIAADPRVLKLGSKVTISAGPWSGTYLVSDTGGSIKGKKIDIWVPGCSEARKFGRRTVQVFSAQ
ncbi:MAG: 3D domain-containing protein [Pyrinomonadaceae bacterium]|nr:3D domain-containing protein [Pyrinomonadaceae bacterium]MBP6213988.1 3D domain-containing protein [Pyrinomonadaceae bacterium]